MLIHSTKAEQQLRGSIALPHYYGKTSRILVIDDSITADQAKKAGAEFFGGDEKIAEIKDGWLDFDVLITTPKFMPKLAKLGKILGPKGLMPNPKLGTVTTKVVDTIKERPSTIKGEYIKSIYISSTMGPSIRIK